MSKNKFEKDTLHRFYADIPLAIGAVVHMPKPQAWHMIRVLRMRVGAELLVFNGRGGEYRARVVMTREPHADVEILAFNPREAELPFSVTLWQGISSQDKMSWTVEKAVELGVNVILPLTMQRSVVRLDGEGAQDRLERFQAIAQAACEQCGRNRMPMVLPIHVLTKGFPLVSSQASKLVLVPGAETPITQIPAPQPGSEVILYVGPEGGHAPDELAEAITQGFKPVSLGPRTLRTETAAAATLAMLAAIWKGV